MSSPKGYSSQEKDDRLSAQFTTVEPVRRLQNGMSVVAHQFVYQVEANAHIGAGSTESVIQCVGHAAQKGDVLHLFTEDREVKVWDVTTNTIILAETLSAAPTPGDIFEIYRHKYPRVDSGGSVLTTAVEVATAATGDPAPAVNKIVGGVDYGTNQAYPVAVDAVGVVQVAVTSSALPSDAATETTLQTLATEATVSTLASETTLQTLATEATVSTLATEATLSALNGKITACDTGSVTISSSALPTGAATESTLATLDGKVTACDTGNVTIASSALPSGAATESTLSTLNGKVTACNTGAVTVSSSVLPTGAATESTLSTLNGKVTACNTGAVTISSSALPSGAATETTLSALNTKVTACNTGAVTISTALPSGANTIGKVDVNTLSVVDLLDAGILDTSSTNINGSASAPTQVVATLAAAVKKVQLLDTTGAFIGVYTGAALSEVLQFVMGPGSDQTIEHSISAGTRISLKRLDSTTAVSSGIVALNFIG